MIQRSRSSFLDESQASVSQPLPSAGEQISNSVPRSSPTDDLPENLESILDSSGRKLAIQGSKSSNLVDRSSTIETSHPSAGRDDDSTTKLSDSIQKMIENLDSLHSDLSSI